MIRLLLIDNYDSYTFNLYQLLEVVEGCHVDVIRNDELSWDELQRRLSSYDAAVISPGPGTPECATDIGVCRQLLESCPDFPILGVCLGHQALALVAGGRVLRAPEPIHGRLSEVEHTGHPLFAGIPSGVGAGYRVVRYHSLAVEPASLPDALQPIAWTCGGHHVMQTRQGQTSTSAAGASDRLIMALAHRSRPHYGVQFHPESIGTEFGHRLLSNYRDLILQQKGLEAPAYAPPPSAPLRERLLQSEVLSADGPGSAEGSIALAVSEVVGVKVDQTRSFGSENIFRSLFGADGPAGPSDSGTTFWLDSADDERGQFSFMGGRGGALWRRITYRLRPGGQGCDVTELHADGTRSTSFEPAGVLSSLERILQAHPLSAEARTRSAALPFDFCGGLVGYLGYELKAETGGHAAHVSREPDAALFFTDRFIAVDHRTGAVFVVTLWREGNGADRLQSEQWRTATSDAIVALAASSVGREVNGVAAPLLTVERAREAMGRFVLARSPERYLEDIAECDRALHSGDSYEVCLTNRLERNASTTSTSSSASSAPLLRPWPFYQLLRAVNRAPYAAWLDFGCADGPIVCCSSPERFLRCYRDGWLEARPIKGTAPRFLDDPQRDQQAADDLAASEKDRAENLMIVDLLRNDLGRVCEPGSVHVPGLMEIESYATVHQMVSTICGVRKRTCSAIDCIRAAFPGGSMTGAPKVRTMEIIDRLEGRAREVYSGSIGFFALNGSFDLNIVIRTAVFHSRGDVATIGQDISIGAGGAIVVQSDPAGEVEEMLLKARALLRTAVLSEVGIDAEHGGRELARNAAFWQNMISTPSCADPCK